MKLIDYNFREIKHQLVYFNNPAIAAPFAEMFGREKPAGVLTYGFVDKEKGSAFEVLALSVEQDGMVGFTGRHDDAHATLYYNDVKNVDAFLLKDIDTTDWLDKINAVVSANQFDEIVLAFRNETMFDEFRSFDHPDVVNVTVFKPGKAMLSCKVRFEAMDEKGMHGVVVQPPKEDVGLKVGDTVDFFVYQVAPEMNTLVCPLK